MSKFGQRLRRMLRGRKEALDEGPLSGALGALLAENRQLLERLRLTQDPGEDPVPVESLKGATTTTTPFGPCFHLDTHFDLDEKHGSVTLASIYSLETSHLEQLVGDKRLRSFSAERALFLDIEATGLDHGAGTFAFMVGLGFRDGARFTVRQLFLRNVAEEQALLHVLKEHLDSFDTLVSFNGKSYDLTVLQSRMVIQRFYTTQECSLKLQPHLDLLHLARNIYRDRFEDTRLPTLERGALGFHRQDDIPSSLVPSMWYQFLRSSHAGPIHAVAEHNLFDVLSMVTLAAQLISDTRSPGRDVEFKNLLCLNLGRVLHRRGHFSESVQVLGEAVVEELGEERGRECYRLMARCFARQNAIADQGQTLRKWVASYPRDALGWTSLAIFQERSEKDIARALNSARHAEIIVSDAPARRRIDRLEKRLKRLK